MSTIKKSYGICVKECFIINRNTNKCEKLLQGELIRILEPECASVHSARIVIKQYNFEENCFKNDFFECAKQDTAYVVEALWMHLIGTKQNHKRMRIYNARDLVLRIKRGNEFIMKYDYTNIKFIIELLDNVKEVGIGCFVGLKIQEPPEKRETLVALYKKHFNQSTNLLLFRIEQLLDALIQAEQAKACPSSNGNTKPDVSTFPSLYSDIKKNISPFAVGDRIEISAIRQQQTGPFTPSITENSVLIDPGKIDAIKSDVNSCSTTMTNGLVSNLPPMISSGNVLDNTNSKTSFDYICDSSPRSNDCRAISGASKELESKQLIDLELDDLNQNSICIDRIKRQAVSLRNGKENSPCVQLVEISHNEKGAIPKKDSTVTNNWKKGRYNKKNFIYNDKPKEVTYNKAEQLNWKNPIRCDICKSSFSRMLVLKCTHNICVNCFGGKISRLIGTDQIQCPFKSGSNSFCNYHLDKSELVQLRQMLDDLVLLPAIHNSRSNIKSCIDCKIVHDNMTCIEYRNASLKSSSNASPKPSSNMSSKHSSNVFTRTHADTEAHTTDRVNDPNASEIIMKCHNKDCSGFWFRLAIDKSAIFKCPTCELYNCMKCNTIHKNGTCDDYEYKNSGKRATDNINRQANAGTKFQRKWNCTFCTFENFGFGAFCRMCRKVNTIKRPDFKSANLREKWTCKHCTYQNFSFGIICQICRKTNSN